jgi:hypothetical protein
MPVCSGGYTEDVKIVEYLDQSGLAIQIYKEVVKKAIRSKLTTIENTGTLSIQENALQDSGDYGIDRVMDFIKLDTKYTARGIYMPYADIQSCINTQWTNILKRWL